MLLAFPCQPILRGGPSAACVRAFLPIAFLLFLGTSSLAQTQINLTKQSKSADFATFSATRPWKLVSSLPGACQVGESAFLTTAILGQQLHFCTTGNNWNNYTTTALQAADLLDFSVVKTAASQLTVGPYCSSGRPCRARFGEAVVSLTEPVVITVNGVSSTGMLLVWLDYRGLSVGSSAGSGTVSCTGLCTVVPTLVTTFPVGSVPIGAVPYVGNVMNEVSGLMDKRAILSAQHVEAGPSANLVVTSNGFTGAAEVDLSDRIDLAGYTSTRVLKRGIASNRPAACQLGDLYHQTDQTAGIYLCKATNQWQGPLVSVDASANITAVTGDVSPITLVAASHGPGVYRICGSVAVTTGAGAATLNLQLSWRSPIAGVDQVQTLASTAVATATENQACRLIRTTGESAISVDPSTAGAAIYSLALAAERLF